MRASLNKEIAKRVADATDIYYPTLLSIVPEKGVHLDQCLTCACSATSATTPLPSRLVLRIVTGIDLKSDNRRFLYPALWYQCRECSCPLNEDRVILIDGATARQLTDELDRCARMCEEDCGGAAAKSVNVLRAFFEIVHHAYPEFMQLIMSAYNACMYEKCGVAANRWCNVCHAAWYCSDECMALDWHAHHADDGDCRVFSFRRLWLDHLGIALNGRRTRSKKKKKT